MDKFLAQRLRQSREALQQNRMYFMWAAMSRAGKHTAKPVKPKKGIWSRIKDSWLAFWSRVLGVFA